MRNSLIAIAHERWVPHNVLAPINHAYFRSMRGEVLFYSLAAAGAIACIILLWYLVAIEVVERLTPATAEARERENRRGPIDRNARRVLVGKDAWFLDKLVRLFGSAYQRVILRRARTLLGYDVRPGNDSA